MKNDKRRAQMNMSTLILVGVAFILAIIALVRGQGIFMDGIQLAGSTLWNNLIILLAGFIIAGLMQVLIPKEWVVNWMGNKAGVKAVLIGCIAGGLMPGSPYAAFPVVAGFYTAGAGLGATVGFITAWSLWSVSRLPVEIALINPKIALIRYAITFIVPPAAGLIAHSLNKFIG
jgi:uncharacterized membrane protein YraQ (UPF0718 family)